MCFVLSARQALEEPKGASSHKYSVFSSTFCRLRLNPAEARRLVGQIVCPAKLCRASKETIQAPIISRIFMMFSYFNRITTFVSCSGQ
jgi:hypothetical protein